MIKMNRQLDAALKDLKNTNAEIFYHSLRTKKLVLMMIEKTNALGITNYNSDEIDIICKGALLHDIGKLQIDNFILTKDSYLTSEETEAVKKHVDYGYKLVKNHLESDELEFITNICKLHHERCDGSGYNGITDLPEYVNIVAVCDVFDALFSDRIYRDGFPADKSIDLIRNGACGGFEPKLVDIMEEISKKL